MPAARTRTADVLRRLTALSLFAWLAGLGCVLGCAAGTGAPGTAHASRAPQTDHAKTAASHSNARGESCAAMRKHGCCSGVEGDGADGRASAGAEERGAGAAGHCPLSGRHASDPARKLSVDGAPTASTSATQSPAPGTSFVRPPRAAGVRVYDRGGTYLRCCVFLI